MGKNNQEKIDTARNIIQGAVKNNGVKFIIIAVIVLIIVLQAMWNMMGSKLTSEIQPLAAQVEALNARMDETMKFTAASDFEALKADFDALKNTLQAESESVKKAGEAFDVKLNAVVKAEEAKLEVLAKALEDQRAYVEGLKSLLAGETKE